MIYVILFILGSVVGYFYKDLRDSIKDLKTKLLQEKPEVGATPASYGQVKGYADNNSPIGLVNPKTPEQLEWEHRQEISKGLSGQ